MDRNYHSLHENRIFMGGAKDVEAMEKNEGIDVVVDLRSSGGRRSLDRSPKTIQQFAIPNGMNAETPRPQGFPLILSPKR